jgi:hypothetical protein
LVEANFALSFWAGFFMSENSMSEFLKLIVVENRIKMKKFSYYKVAVGIGPVELQTAVYTLLNSGYEPVGGLVIGNVENKAGTPAAEVTRCFHAMILPGKL